MILWLLLYTLSSYSQDNVTEEFCFSSPAHMREISSKFKFILVPADKVQENENCLTVNTPPHRRELLQNYMKRLEPAVKLGFSSVEIKRDPCEIKVEKIRTLFKEKNEATMNTTLNGGIGSTEVERKSKDVSKIQTLKEFELTVNQDSIKGECRVINSNRYEISLEVRKDATPLIPPVPAGTVVVLTNPQYQNVQETSRLQTTLQLERGQRVEIGSVIKNLKGGSHKVDINTEANLEKADETQIEKVYLSLD